MRPPTANPAIDLISDIPLQVAVELGKTKKNINDILNMGLGSSSCLIRWPESWSK